MLSTELVCFRKSWNNIVQSWNAFYRVGMHTTELEHLCTGLECFLQGWNSFDTVGIPLFRVEMLSRVLEYFRQSWNTCVHSWNIYVQGCNSF
jgi:hypothetical protein